MSLSNSKASLYASSSVAPKLSATQQQYARASPSGPYASYATATAGGAAVSTRASPLTVYEVKSPAGGGAAGAGAVRVSPPPAAGGGQRSGSPYFSLGAMVADGAGSGLSAGTSRGPLGGGMTAFSAAALQKSRSLHSQSATRMADAAGAYFPSLAHGQSSSSPTQAQVQAMAAAYAAAYSQPMPVPPQRDPHTAHAYAAPANPYASAVEFARAGIRAGKSGNGAGANGFGVTITSPQIAAPSESSSAAAGGVARGRLSTKLAFKQARSRFARAAWDDALTPDLGMH
jgi:hypothetical protein